MLVNVDKTLKKKAHVCNHQYHLARPCMEHTVEVKDNVKATVEGSGSVRKRGMMHLLHLLSPNFII